MSKWIDFLRKYCPIPSNDDMYYESIQRAARRFDSKTILFEHPFRQKVMRSLSYDLSRNIILTRTACDGKTHHFREIWRGIGGDEQECASDEPCLLYSYSEGQLHFSRDLSTWAPKQVQLWTNHPKKYLVFLEFWRSLFNESANTYIVAAND